MWTYVEVGIEQFWPWDMFALQFCVFVWVHGHDMCVEVRERPVPWVLLTGLVLAGLAGLTGHLSVCISRAEITRSTPVSGHPAFFLSLMWPLEFKLTPSGLQGKSQACTIVLVSVWIWTSCVARYLIIDSADFPLPCLRCWLDTVA